MGPSSSEENRFRSREGMGGITEIATSAPGQHADV
jgi:hypothetical protein